MERSLKIVGPASAALHVFAQIAVIFELGLVGTAIKSYWLPITRRFWTEVFNSLEIFDFKPTDAEKDAMTAVAFFTPLAVTAAYLWLKDRGKDDGENEYGPGPTAPMMRVAAFFASILVLFFVSQQIIADALSIYDRSTAGLRSVELVSMLSIVGLGGVIVMLVLFYRLDTEIRRSLLIFGATFGALLEFIIIGGPVLLAAYFAVTELGMIRSAALLLVTFCIVLTISVRPVKVLQVALVVVGLLLASWLVTIAQRIGETINTT
jgi:hypothetical protein